MSPPRKVSPLSDWPLTREPAHDLYIDTVKAHATRYVWQIYGKDMAELEIRHEDWALLVWDRHGAQRYDSGHRFADRPTVAELTEFVTKYAVNLLAPLLAQATAR